MVTPTYCISLNFFPKSLGIIDTEGKKKIIIIIIVNTLWCVLCEGLSSESLQLRTKH